MFVSLSVCVCVSVRGFIKYTLLSLLLFAKNLTRVLNGGEYDTDWDYDLEYYWDYDVYSLKFV